MTWIEFVDDEKKASGTQADGQKRVPADAGPVPIEGAPDPQARGRKPIRREED